uniref:Apple domain-containing protein n=1 Tax=Setaria digitata TaxID=48799 RepID=A0A915PNC6_9BILA
MVTEDSDNVISSSCVSSVVPAIGFFLFVNDCNLGESEQSDDITSKQFTDNSLAIMKQHREPVILTDQLPIQKIQTDATIRSSCASGLSIHIEVIDGIQVIAKFLATFQTHTAEACLYLCTRNVLTDGSPLKTECRSAQYNRISKQCILFNTSITPTGYAQYIPNDDVIYFEKIYRSVYRMCGEALRRVPQYILVGHATAVINAPSHTYCVEMCLRSLETFDFTCRSAIHFYEHPKANCILNKDSARTRPQYFISEANEKVDYVELAECIMRDTYDLQKLPRNITSE